jgi:nitrate reductase NapAB chaperone NapD
MAIAGLVVMTTQEGYQPVWEALSADARITDVRPGGESCRLAAVLEASSRDMEDELSRLLAWEGVLTVDIALLSYEDEVAAGGDIPCPPHRPRKRSIPDT